MYVNEVDFSFESYASATVSGYRCQRTLSAQILPLNQSRRASRLSSPSSSPGCCIWSIQAPNERKRLKPSVLLQWKKKNSASSINMGRSQECGHECLCLVMMQPNKAIHSCCRYAFISFGNKTQIRS